MRRGMEGWEPESPAESLDSLENTTESARVSLPRAVAGEGRRSGERAPSPRATIGQRSQSPAEHSMGAASSRLAPSPRQTYTSMAGQAQGAIMGIEVRTRTRSPLAMPTAKRTDRTRPDIIPSRRRSLEERSRRAAAAADAARSRREEAERAASTASRPGENAKRLRAQAIAADVATRAETLVSKVVKERAEAADDARGRREKIADAAATTAAREAQENQEEVRAKKRHELLDEDETIGVTHVIALDPEQLPHLLVCVHWRGRGRVDGERAGHRRWGNALDCN